MYTYDTMHWKMMYCHVQFRLLLVKRKCREQPNISVICLYSLYVRVESSKLDSPWDSQVSP